MKKILTIIISFLAITGVAFAAVGPRIGHATNPVNSNLGKKVVRHLTNAQIDIEIAHYQDLIKKLQAQKTK